MIEESVKKQNIVLFQQITLQKAEEDVVIYMVLFDEEKPYAKMRIISISINGR